MVSRAVSALDFAGLKSNILMRSETPRSVDFPTPSPLPIKDGEGFRLTYSTRDDFSRGLRGPCLRGGRSPKDERLQSSHGLCERL